MMINLDHESSGLCSDHADLVVMRKDVSENGQMSCASVKLYMGDGCVVTMSSVLRSSYVWVTNSEMITHAI